MNIIKADPITRLLSEAEVRDILSKSYLLRMGFNDSQGWPVVAPVWFVFENDRIVTTVERDSRKDKRIQEDERVYFTIDHSGPDVTHGVRGRARAKVVDDHERTVRVVEESVKKYLGSLEHKLGAPLVEEAKKGNTVILELDPEKYAAWLYE